MLLRLTYVLFNLQREQAVEPIKRNRSGSAAAPKPIYYYFSLGTERVSHVRTGYTGAYEGQISSLRRSLLQIGGDATIS
jgi:hypothetical protein